MVRNLPVSSCPCVPALSDWSVYAGGSSAPRDKNSYKVRCERGSRWADIMIDPISSRRGRYLGYELRVAGSFPGRTGLWSLVSPAGEEVNLVARAYFGRASTAAVVARRYAKKHGLC